MNQREKDDQEVGRFLSRREVVTYLGAAAGFGILGTLAQGSTESAGNRMLPQCIGRPEQTEGPYFIDEKINRSDIRTDPSDGSTCEGVPLTIVFHVLRIESPQCLPLSGAIVDLWHCDATGKYSGVRDNAFNTVGKKFLRGYQVTDNSGKARFETIFPGWYPGRTVHIHFKIRTDPVGKRGYEFTSQLYFEDSLSDQIFLRGPYSSRGRRMMRNDDDFIFRLGGKGLILALAPEGEGYSTVFEIGLPI
jgi:protocatechuate 3,4-dioxygenase beta subunit